MDEKDKLQTPPGGTNQPPQTHAPGDPGSGGDDKSKTVPLQALQEERAKNAKLKEELEKLKGKTPTNQNNGEQQIPKIKLKAKDLIDLTPEQLEETLNEVVQTAVNAALERTSGEFLKFQSKSEVDRTISKYAIFKDTEDPALANAALNDLGSEIAANPEKPLDELAKEIAQKWSKYKVAGKSGKPDGGKVKSSENPPPTPLPSAGGGAEVSHLKQDRTPVRSFNEVSAAADKKAAAWEQEQRARGE